MAKSTKPKSTSKSTAATKASKSTAATKASKSTAATKASKSTAATKAKPASPSAATIKRILQSATTRATHRSTLQLVDFNPRQISKPAFNRLKDSIKRFGLVTPPVVNSANNHIVGGHQRIKALDDIMGSTDYDLDASFVELNDAQERELNILLNNPELQGQYDLELLGEVVAEIHDMGGDIHATGFATTDFHMLFDDELLTHIGLDFHREQLDAESPVVDQLDAIYEATSVANTTNEANGTNETSPHAESDAESANESRPDDHPSQDAEPSPQASAVPPLDKPGREMNERELIALKDDDYDRYKRAMQDRKNAYREKRETGDDAADLILTLTFDKPDQIRSLLSSLKLNPHERYFDYRDFCTSAGIGLDGFTP